MNFDPTKCEILFRDRGSADVFADVVRTRGWAGQVKVAPTLPLYKGAVGGKYTSVHLLPWSMATEMDLAQAAKAAGAVPANEAMPWSESTSAVLRRKRR